MARGHISFDQIVFAPGTYTTGNAVTTNSAGQLVDSGTSATAGSGGGFTVNGSATVSVNGTAVSYNDTVTVNGVAL